MSTTVRYGKTLIRLLIEGCYTCGTSWSSGWTPIKTLSGNIGNKKVSLDLSQCDECSLQSRSTQDRATP